MTSPSSSPLLVVTIPAFNEEEKIAQTIARIPRSFPHIGRVRVHVIDDGSTDGTAQKARDAGADLVLSHHGNRGIGITFRTGIEQALAAGADYCVNIDADGQFDPTDIPQLLTPIFERRADMVVADRFSKKSAQNIPFLKEVLNRLGAHLVGWFINAPIADLTCGFRALTRETMLRLNLPGDFTYTQETIIDALGKNLKIVWVPVVVTYYNDRKSRVVKSITKFVSTSISIIIKAVRDVRPMKFFGIPGLILTGAGTILFVIFLINYFATLQITPYRNIILIGAILFVVGLQFLVFALMADMIKNSRRVTEDLLYLMRKHMYLKKKNEENKNE